MLSLRLTEQRKEWLVKALFGLVVFAVCLWIMILPLFREITLSEHRALDDQGRLDLFQDTRALNKKVLSLEASLATLADRSLMLGKISDVAAKNGIDIKNLTPRTSKEGAYTSLKIDMEGRGSFFKLLNFLRAIEALHPPVIAQDLALSRNRSGVRFSEGETGQETLGIRIVLESYLKQSQRKKQP